MIILILIAVYFNIHLFQLNGYHFKGLLKSAWKHFLLIRILIYALYLLNIKYLLIPACLFTIYPRYIHKKIVYTKRMIRLMAVALVISILASIFLPFESLLFSELIILVSSILIYPAEYFINKHYIDMAKRKSFNGITIGITGSYGKTSTKNFILAVLSMKYNVLATPKSYNTPLGISTVINNSLTDIYDFFLVEMGAAKSGDIEELMNIIRPDYSVITTIGNQHLKTFKSLDNIYKEKIKILDNKTNVSFINGDIDLARRYFSYGNNGDIYAKNIVETSSGIDFDACIDDKTFHLKTHIFGVHNVSNMLCAFLIGRYFGVSDEKIIYALEGIDGVENRLTVKRFKDGVIIDDSFNSNIRGALNALDTLKSFEGKKIIITPGFVDLGADNDNCLLEYAKKINSVCQIKIIVRNRRLAKMVDGIYVRNFKKGFNIYKNIEGTKSLLIENDLPDNY